MVINMDNADKPGSHWVAIYMPHSHHIFYYDSYGHPPQNPHIKDFLLSFPNITQQHLLFQSYVTDVCGHYVLYFIFMCSLGYSLEKIQSILQAQNNADVYVVRYVNKYIA